MMAYAIVSLVRADVDVLAPLDWFNDCIIDFVVYYQRQNKSQQLEFQPIPP